MGRTATDSGNSQRRLAIARCRSEQSSTQLMKAFPMHKIAALVVTLTFGCAALAQGQSCSATAADKKLAGAAKSSYLKKCQADAKAACEAQAAEKKLAGAAKSSFEKKCLKDSVGG